MNELPLDIKNKICGYLYFSDNICENIKDINYFIRNYHKIYYNFYYEYFDKNLHIFLYRFLKYLYFFLYLNDKKKYNKYNNLIVEPFNYSVINNHPVFSLGGREDCSIEEQYFMIIYNSSVLELKHMYTYIMFEKENIMF